MQYGFVIPGGDIHSIAELAQEAEEAGWDGVFIPDCILIEAHADPAFIGFDPWVVLAAMAMRTERVKLGTMLTAISRRRPWKLARETTTLDQLSNGRVILSVGLGALDDAGFGKVGEATDRKTRAELMDEGLDILAGLWSGKPFSYDGKHYKIEEMTFVPTPVQHPRIPVWVVGAWPVERSMRRVLKWDGLLPTKRQENGQFGGVTPEDIRVMKQYIEETRSDATPFDIIWEGETPGDNADQAAALVGPFAEAGATWWLESMWNSPDGLRSVRQRIEQGPPKVT
ncbi:MAG TPA: LLM class flavin-dependent oxidoreductase [Chloroflexia bacterium]|nr:LLM class flavin-dependent oxidoreductase [Chloroflexia bacterium]